MQIVEYTPEHFEALRRAASQKGIPGLEYRPFVDFYYRTFPSCRLYLALAKDGSVQGTIGVDQMRFEYESREMILGLATNFHAFQPGIGGYLYLKWMKCCPGALEFGGTEDAHRVIRSTGKWTYFSGVKQYVLNYIFPVYPGDAWWRVAAKSAARSMLRRKVPRYARRIPPSALQGLSVCEERSYPKDILPRHSPFRFRFAPSVEYLNWRYGMQLPFVRYRLFRILTSGIPSGYVILSDSKDRVIVAQCDGEDPAALAYGVLLSILEVARGDSKPRTVLMTSSHVGMQEVYAQFGFKFRGENMEFAVWNIGGTVDLATDTSTWLINSDWGDLGLLSALEAQVQKNKNVWPQIPGHHN
jgi:hypothetical protein